MSFSTDKQTLNDLNIIGKRTSESIYTIFNHTYTQGGAAAMEQMFRYPLSDVASINNRSEIIQYFKSTKTVFPFPSVLFDSAEEYLSNTDNRNRLRTEENSLGRKFRNLIGSDTEYQLIHKGVSSTIQIICIINDFVNGIVNTFSETAYNNDAVEIKEILSDEIFKPILKIKHKEKLSFPQVAEGDKIIRYEARDKIKKLLYFIYNLDVYISVANVALDRGFVFPKAVAKEKRCVEIKGMYHPQIPNAIANEISITPEKNIIFLTGANMAGKSTLMKTLGVNMFLAHMGFPVAATDMTFSVRDGIYTTINLADNLAIGYSHFYAEVVRVKQMAEQVRMSKYLFIVFDELFRGTNVKDAYEATIAITGAFAQKPNCIFIVSTHIIEAGEELEKKFENIEFIYMPTLMEGKKPVYPYKLQRGITADRHGMIIINNEEIIKILESRKKQNI